jgi:hypothetical protein
MSETQAGARLRGLATGISGPAEELSPLTDAGHEVVTGRPLDQPGRAAYTEAELVDATRDVGVILASHLETIGRCVMAAAPRARCRGGGRG